MSGEGNKGPEGWLERALGAGDPGSRAKYATRGLASAVMDTDTQTLLLRQLYLSHMETGRFWDARAVAEHMIQLGELGDVACHDAARACLATGEIRAAAGFIRIASRDAPASRRAFHHSCLGSLYYLQGDSLRAVTAFERAVRWATTKKRLYAAQLLLAGLTAQPTEAELRRLKDCYTDLAASRRSGGYEFFVLGEIARRLGRLEDCRRWFRAFIDQSEAASIGVRAGLRAELARARSHLDDS